MSKLNINVDYNRALLEYTVTIPATKNFTIYKSAAGVPNGVLLFLKHESGTDTLNVDLKTPPAHALEPGSEGLLVASSDKAITLLRSGAGNKKGEVKIKISVLR